MRHSLLLHKEVEKNQIKERKRSRDTDRLKIPIRINLHQFPEK